MSWNRKSALRAMLRAAFDCGITHIDMANNYGPVPGAAEENFGRIFEKDLRPYRDELVLSSKAGYTLSLIHISAARISGVMEA